MKRLVAWCSKPGLQSASFASQRWQAKWMNARTKPYVKSRDIEVWLKLLIWTTAEPVLNDTS